MGDSYASSLVQIGRATACGWGLHAGSSLASSIATGKILSGDASEWNPATVGCLKFGAFLGAFAGAYRVAIRLLRQHRRDDGVNALLAAALASLAISLQPARRRLVMTLFLGTRAASALLKTMSARKVLRMSNTAVAMLFLANVTFIIHSALLHPTCLPPSYYKSLLRWSIRLNDTKLAQLARPQPPPGPRGTCREVAHPSMECVEANVYLIVRSWLNYMKIYGVLYAVPVVLFRAKDLLKRPLATVRRVAFSAARSSLFLALCNVGLSIGLCCSSKQPCLSRYVTLDKGMSSLLATAVGFLTSLGILVERPTRRFEMTMYTVPMVLYTMVRRLQESGVLPRIKHLSILSFSVCMMVIMHAYERQRNSINPLTASFLSFLLR